MKGARNNAPSDTWHDIKSSFHIPYYRKLTLHEIKVLEINANLMENDFRIKKINAKEEVEFHKKEINAIILAKIGEDTDITSDSNNDEHELEIL